MMNRLLAVLAVLLACVGMNVPDEVRAGEKAAGIKIEKPWTRVTPPGAKVAAGFMTITNTGSEADRLVGGSVALANDVEIHEMSMKDGIMRMNEVDAGLEISPGATVVLRPGGYHLMFLGLTAEPQEGKPVQGKLKFEKAGELAIEFAVAPLGAKSIGGGDKMTGSHEKDGMDHGKHHMKHGK